MADLFGVAVSPFDLDDWEAATGITPDLCMLFEPWSNQRMLTDQLAKAVTFGHTSIAITWEPWQPVDPGVSAQDQGALQPDWCNQSILDGAHDDYIDGMARCFRDSGLQTIYLRYAHEMNGDWYPWYQRPDTYVAAWKYIRNRMRSLRGAWNVKMVWAPNPDLWRPCKADWLQRLLPYWPGLGAVDFVGSTMIDFGGNKYYPVSQFGDAFDLTSRVFLKGVRAMEVNVAEESAVNWLNDLATYVDNGSHPLPLVILSQGSSRAGALGGTGTLDWSVADDPNALTALKRVVSALHNNF